LKLTLTGGTDITVLNFSFTDGVQTYTQANANLNTSEFDIATNANGNISEWVIGVDAPTGSDFVATSSVSIDNGCDCDAGTQLPAQAQIVGDSGTWVTQTPEPGEFTLCGAALLALVGVRRRFADRRVRIYTHFPRLSLWRTTHKFHSCELAS